MTPIDPLMHYLLLAVGVLGSVALYTAASRMFAPPAEADASDLSKLAKKEVGTSSVSQRLFAWGKLPDASGMAAAVGTPVDPKEPSSANGGRAKGKGKSR